MIKKKEVLDKLAFDPNDYGWSRRYDFAMRGEYLSILINDPDPNVRAAVAEQGYGLDTLITDKYYGVRLAIAKQGHGLEILVNDEHWEVRRAVAKQGYGLDILVNDEDPSVRYVAQATHTNDKIFIYGMFLTLKYSIIEFLREVQEHLNESKN